MLLLILGTQRKLVRLLLQNFVIKNGGFKYNRKVKKALAASLRNTTTRSAAQATVSYAFLLTFM